VSKQDSTLQDGQAPKEKPMYADEDGCVLIGTADIEIPFPSEEERSVSVEYIFGNTEISMTATDDLYGTICGVGSTPVEGRTKI
jgi:hypothetical protein